MVLRSIDEVRWPRQKSPQVERRKARLPFTRQAGAFLEVALDTMRPNRGSPPSCSREKEEKAAPRALRLPGLMNHVSINVPPDETADRRYRTHGCSLSRYFDH